MRAATSLAELPQRADLQFGVHALSAWNGSVARDEFVTQLFRDRNFNRGGATGVLVDHHTAGAGGDSATGVLARGSVTGVRAYRGAGASVWELMPEAGADAALHDAPVLVLTDSEPSLTSAASGSIKTAALGAAVVANIRAITTIRGLEAPERLILEGIELAQSATAACAPLPMPRLTADGELMFYGRKDRVYLDLGVHGDGTSSFFCRNAAGREFVSEDDVNIGAGLDANVCRVLQELADVP